MSSTGGAGCIHRFFKEPDMILEHPTTDIQGSSRQVSVRVVKEEANPRVSSYARLKNLPPL
jgi:hypothetical protein